MNWRNKYLNSDILFYSKDIGSPVSNITISIFDPNLATITDTALNELESLNKAELKSIKEKLHL